MLQQYQLNRKTLYSCSYFILLLIVINFLSACGKKLIKDCEQTKQWQLGHALHFDIPIPKSFLLIKQSSRKEKDLIHDYMQYKGTLNIGSIICFYKQHMERSGWELQDFSENNEGFIYCSKSNKKCGIQIRTDKTLSNIPSIVLSIFITSH